MLLSLVTLLWHPDAYLGFSETSLHLFWSRSKARTSISSPVSSAVVHRSQSSGPFIHLRYVSRVPTVRHTRRGCARHPQPAHTHETHNCYSLGCGLSKSRCSSRKLDYWGCAFGGDIGVPVPSCCSLYCGICKLGSHLQQHLSTLLQSSRARGMLPLKQ